MADNDPNDNRNTILFAGKEAIIVGTLIVLGLAAYFMVSVIRDLPPDDPSQQAALKAPQDVPQKQEPPVQGPPQPASTPVSDTEEVTVGFRVSGRITQMFFAERAEVKQGDVLASLDKAPFEAVLASARSQLQAAQTAYNNSPHLSTRSFNIIEAERANVETAQHTYDAAHTELEKRRALLVPGELDNVYNNNVQSEHDAKLNLERAQRKLAQQKNVIHNSMDRDDDKVALKLAQNNVADAEANLADTQLSAPASGIIASRVSEIGATVTVGAAVYTLSVPKAALPNPQ